MTPHQVLLIRSSLQAVRNFGSELVGHFYALLFLRHPPLREMFPPAMDLQRDRLLSALLYAAQHIDDEAELTRFLAQLSRDHRKYGEMASYYEAVGEALLDALAKYAGSAWSLQTEQAWQHAYISISSIMLAADEDSRHRPSSWLAEVVTHERLTPNIARLTVRPDAPYPFRAGQYASIETALWPKVWRPYSIANAPRPDNQLTFHVKRVPAGWVSGALVDRTVVGDRIRLGAPLGSMVLEPGRDPVLLIGGGVGAAPMLALLEELADQPQAASGPPRLAEFFLGATTSKNLYLLPEVLRFKQRHSWLTVQPVISEEATFGLSGTVPHALEERWSTQRCYVYVAGPPEMVRQSVQVLQQLGVDRTYIHHDPLIEPFNQLMTSPEAPRASFPHAASAPSIPTPLGAPPHLPASGTQLLNDENQPQAVDFSWFTPRSLSPKPLPSQTDATRPPCTASSRRRTHDRGH